MFQGDLFWEYDPYEKFVVLSVQFGPTNFQVKKYPAILSIVITGWLIEIAYNGFL